jgi:hypothetical protein
MTVAAHGKVAAKSEGSMTIEFSAWEWSVIRAALQNVPVVRDQSPLFEADMAPNNLLIRRTILMVLKKFPDTATEEDQRRAYEEHGVTPMSAYIDAMPPMQL